MKRYDVPRVAFVNKLDRQGANPWKVVDDLRNLLKLNAAAVQIPIGLEGEHTGVVDLLTLQSYLFHGPKGEEVEVKHEVPPELIELAQEKRTELIERLADADDAIAEIFL